ncbi:hypothetical protein ACFL57_03065 [Candidatus Margulisiibacteriota bacterium]
MAEQAGSVHDYSASQVADDARCEIMDALKEFAGAKSGSETVSDVSINDAGNIDMSGSDNALAAELGNDFDPTSGTGALILDDTLSKISTVQQCNGQLISDSNKNKSKMQQLGVNQ